MTNKTISKKQSKLFRVERFMDSASEPDNLTPPKSKEIGMSSKANNTLILKPLSVE